MGEGLKNYIEAHYNIKYPFESNKNIGSHLDLKLCLQMWPNHTSFLEVTVWSVGALCPGVPGNCPSLDLLLLCPV